MRRSSFYDYSDACILVKKTISASNTAAAGATVNNTSKKVAFKNCAPFTSSITEINNTQIDYTEDIDIVKPVYNLIKSSNAYVKTSGSLWKYYRDEPVIEANVILLIFLLMIIIIIIIMIIIHSNLNNRIKRKWRHKRC